MKNSEGSNVPQINLTTREDNEWRSISTAEIFDNRKVVVFSLPGAFTPTCSSTHVPRYNQLADTFKQEGIDEIICVSVNDPFVMNAWQEQQSADNIRFLPDGNGAFTEAMGMLVDKADLNFGKRSWRYSMLVNNGVVEKMFIEPDVEGDPFQVSDADTMLDYINPNASMPKAVSMFTKPGCAHCSRAKAVLNENGLTYEEIQLGENGLSFTSLTNITGNSQTPQIYINGELIGGADELEKLFSH